MSDRSHETARDPLIAQHEEAEIDARRARRAANCSTCAG